MKFEYRCLTFKPIRKLSQKEKSLSFKDLTGLLASSDKYLKLTRYDGTYTHEDFYCASGNSECDIFKCLNNGKYYIPGTNELFEWRGNKSSLRFAPGYYEWNIWGVSDKEPLFTFGDLSEDIAKITSKEELIALCQDLIEVWKEANEENNAALDYFPPEEELSALVDDMTAVLNSHYELFVE